MYKKTEKRIYFLLNKALQLSQSEIDLGVHLTIGRISREISTLLKEKNNILTGDMVQKVIQLIAVKDLKAIRGSFVEMLASKEYVYISQNLLEFLDFNEPILSAEIIHALYKMGTVCYVDRILPFSTFGEIRYLHDKANQYLKRAKSKQGRL